MILLLIFLALLAAAAMAVVFVAGVVAFYVIARVLVAAVLALGSIRIRRPSRLPPASPRRTRRAAPRDSSR